MQLTLPITYDFEFNRSLHLEHYAKMDNDKEALERLTPEREIKHLKHVIAGYKGNQTKLKKQLKGKV